MSTKSSKRRNRRTNTTEEEPEKKPDDSIDQSDDNKSTISTETDKDSTATTLEPKDPPETTKNGIEPDEIKQPIVVITISENGDSLPTPEKQITPTIELSDDLEPLVLDSEDPELQFPLELTSEPDKSPILTRCKTRRSQTRNLPTPQTPKLDPPVDDPNKINNELRVNVVRLPQINPEIVITAPDEINDKILDEPENISVHSSSSDVTQESDITNASIFVNFTGNDTNIDLEDTTSYNFIESSKDKSYGETLRCLTGRKGLRPSNLSTNRLYSSNFELTTTDSSKRLLKRKFETDFISPDNDQKRAKISDSSPGLLSYISSPFKGKLGKSDIPTSTPKLTSYKFMHQGSSVIDEVACDFEVQKGEKSAPEAKKWCSVM